MSACGSIDCRYHASCHEDRRRHYRRARRPRRRAFFGTQWLGERKLNRRVDVRVVPVAYAPRMRRC
jgi:hypothetical protein